MARGVGGRPGASRSEAARARLGLGTALVLSLAGLAEPARAACSDTAPASGETVTCDGASVAGVVAPAATDVTVEVAPGATLVPASGQAINLGAGATIGIGAGSTVGNATPDNTYAIRIGDGGAVTIDGLVQGRGGITGPGTDLSTNFAGFSNAEIVVHEGGEVDTYGTGFLGALNGRAGGNTYTIDGTVRDLASGNGILVGSHDVLTLGATGRLISVTGNSANPVYGSGADHVTVTTSAGSLIELHGLGQGISLGTDSEVTLGGLIRSYGDAYPNANSAGGVGVQVGARSTVHLLEGGEIVTGNTAGLSNKGAGGIGISTFNSNGPSNSHVIVDGLIDTQRALGVFAGVGDSVTVGATGRITTRATADAILANLYTSTGAYSFSLDVSGTIEALGTGRGLFVSPSRQAGESAETAARVTVTIREGATLYAAANYAFSEYDGAGSYPEAIDDITVAGTVARGTPGTVIDLNDGADRITFLPTYALTGNVNGGSDAGGPSNPTETDTFALDGGVGTSATFDFAANQIVNFEAGQKLGAGTWTLTGTTTGLAGVFAIDAGTLVLDATMANAGAAVASGAALGGAGAFGGAVTVAGGGRLLGVAGADLGLGSLALADASVIDVALGPPSTAALFDIAGALTLDGRLAVSDAGGFGEGSYRLFDYGGALTDNMLVIQSAPGGFNPGDWSIDTATAGQVTLIVAAGANTQYWDGGNMSPGAVADGRGGSGTWTASTTNWTNQAGTINAAWAGGKAVFNSVAGTAAVEVVGQQSVAGLTFLAPVPGAAGYAFTAGAGGALAIADPATAFDVAGDPGGPVTEAAIGVAIGGAGGLVKTGAGDLALSVANGYAGATRVEAGRLIAAATGALSGGPVTVAGGGLVFTGAGTSAGALAIANASADAGGGLVFANGASAGSAVVTNTGLVRFADTADGEDATIDNRAGGVVDVSARDGLGELDIGSLSGAGAVRLGDQTLALGALGRDEAIGGVIENGPDAVSGANQLVKTGAGALTLAAINTYTGFTTVREGTLLVDGAVAGDVGVYGGRFGGSGTVGGDVTVLAGATLLGRAGADLEMASLALADTSFVSVALGAPSEAALFAVDGALVLDGRLVVSDAGGFDYGTYRLIDYGGPLTDNGLVIQAVPAGFNPGDWDIDTGTAGEVSLIVAQGTGTQYWDGSHMTPGGVVDGRGGSGTWNAGNTNWTNQAGTINAPWAGGNAVFAAAGPATVTLEGAQSVAGLAFLSGADYRLVAGAAGSLALEGAVSFALDQAAGATTTVRLDAPVGGAGGIVKRGGGTLVLAGANGYGGGTSVLGGVLEVASDAALGAAAGAVVLDGGTLRLAAPMASARALVAGPAGGALDTGANAITLSGPLTGSGDVARRGGGTLTYAGDGSAYRGTISLAEGRLVLAGTLGGALAVGDGATLAGTGTLGDLVVEAGGAVAPGASIGTLTATGDVTWRAGSFYDLELAAAGGTDLVAAAGAAAIEGGTVRIATLDPDAQYGDGARYTFLTASEGVSGAFDAIEEHSAFLDFALGYDATSAFVEVATVRRFPDVALTFNQRQAATALARFDVPGDGRAVYNALLLLDADAARSAFDLASGEIYAATLAGAARQADADVAHGLGRALAPAREGWNLWGLGSGEAGRVEGDGNGARYTHDRVGALAGIGYGGARDRWAIGLGAGYAGGGVDLPGRASRARTEGWQAAGYARVGTGAAGFTAAAAAGYAAGEADVRRTVTVGSLSRAVAATPDLDSWALAAEGRFGLALGASWAGGPAARVTYARGSLGAFSESGGDSLALAAGAGNDDSRTHYGAGAFARWTGARAGLELTALYSRADRAPSEAELRLAGAPDPSFRVRAARGERDLADLGLSGHLRAGAGLTVTAAARALVGADERSVSGDVELSWAF